MYSGTVFSLARCIIMKLLLSNIMKLLKNSIVGEMALLINEVIKVVRLKNQESHLT